jgi:hypothetical protein
LRHHLPAPTRATHLPARRQLTRDAIDHAHGTERLAFGRHQRRAGVEAKVRLAGHQRVRREARILRRVRHDEHARLEEGVLGEGARANHLADRQSDLRLEPLALVVGDRDQRDGSVADVRRQRCQVVERLLREGVEQAVLPQRFQAPSFVGGS